MELGTTAILVFFLGGIAAHIFARQAYPWNDKQQPWFWLATMALFGVSLFVLPSLMEDKRLSSAMNSVLAGMCVSEYMRVRYKDKIEKLLNFKNEVGQWKEEDKKKNEKTGKRRKPGDK